MGKVRFPRRFVRQPLFIPVLLLLLSLGLMCSAPGVQVLAEPAADPAPAANAPLTTWTFQGRVYDGIPFDQTHPLARVTVRVYGSNSPYGVAGYGTLLRSTTTDEQGYWALPVYDDDGIWEYYHLREINPAGYTSVNATTVSGVKVHNDCIAMLWPLTGKDLTGNKFWDQRDVTPSVTPSFTPSATVQPTNTRPQDPTATASLTPSKTPTPSWTPTNSVTPQGSATFTPTTRPTEQQPELGPVGFPEAEWPWYAQEEITVYPEPPVAGNLTRLCAYVINRDPTRDHQVMLEFGVANFGIGLPFQPVGSVLVNVPAGGRGDGCVIWTPPLPGHWCVEVVLFQEGYEAQRSQRNLDLDEPLQPGIVHSKTFAVGNPLPEVATISLGLVPHDAAWGFELSQDLLPNMQPGEIRFVTLSVTPPEGLPLPGDAKLVVDVEAYAGNRLIGGFRKVFRPPVMLHRFPDPPFAEREISISPYPPRAGEPTEICVELHNPTDEPRQVILRINWASLGIGQAFLPIGGPRQVFLPPHSTVSECLHWIPPVGGSMCIEAVLEMEGYLPQVSRRNIDADEPLTPGVPHTRTFTVRNPLDHTVDVSLGLVPHQPGWGLELSQDWLPNMQPNESREVALTVTPPEGQPLPEDGALIVDVVASAGEVEIGGFRKIFRLPVPLHKPRDPIYAESEIGIDPYPLLPGQPAKLSVELFNPTDTDQVVTTTFSVAPLGIGLPFSTEHITPNPVRIFVPAHGAARGHVVWAPPDFAGKFCVQVSLEIAGHAPVWSRRNIDVGEPLRPGMPHALTFELGAGDYQEPVTVTLGVITHRPGWHAAVSPDLIPNVVPGQTISATLVVTPALDAVLGTGEPIVDVEAFVDGELLGGLRKLDIPPVPLHKPHEKGYAESEIVVAPYPPQVGQISVISTTLQNASDAPVTVELEYGWADFGMGIPFDSTGMDPITAAVTLPPWATTMATTDWTPSQSGHQCVLVRMQDVAHLYQRQVSQRNVDVAEPPPCDVTKVFSFTVYNDSPFTVTVDIGMVTFNVPESWQVTTDPSGSVSIGPFSEAVITVSVTIPCPVNAQAAWQEQQMRRLQAVSGSVPIIDVEGYAHGDLVGGIEIRFEEPASELTPGLWLPLIAKGR